jgi:hypothetical protein
VEWRDGGRDDGATAHLREGAKEQEEGETLARERGWKERRKGGREEISID